MEENPKMFCPHCGGENEQKSKYCINCGIQIPEVETDLTEAKESIEPGVVMTNTSQIPAEASAADNSSDEKQQEDLNLEFTETCKAPVTIAADEFYTQSGAAAGSYDFYQQDTANPVTTVAYKQEELTPQAVTQPEFISVQPVQGQPVQGQPVQGQPVQGQPVQGQPVQGQPVQGQPVQGQLIPEQTISGQPIYQQQPTAAGSNGIGFSIASMVCGIVALLSCCIPCISIVVAIVGIVLGIISLTNKYDGRGMAIAGVVMGIIFLVLCVVMILLLCFSSIMETLISEY